MASAFTALGLGFALGVAAIAGAKAATGPATVETILLVRHGEKPALGLGQLDCQGLNRALALPAVLERGFGKPAAIFAPDPAEAKEDAGRPYDYVRPLATIEPAAIAFGLPVDASIGVSQIAALQRKLEAPDYRDALVLVGWEHHYIVALSRAILAGNGGDASAVPDWRGDDFDGIYVVRITRTGQTATASFERRREGLDGQSAVCPGPAMKSAK